MLKSMDFPWGKGIGTWGFNFSNRRVDFQRVEGKWVKFVANYDGLGNVVRRSWYTRENGAWKLTRREDGYGRWAFGKRKPPLISLGNRVSAEIAQDIRRKDPQMAPYQIIDWYGETLEVISYPVPESYGTTIMLREPNNPGTLREVVLVAYDDREVQRGKGL